ncbi:MAG: LysM peptidoglycan-binding domain-containing protein [Burkholderiaceae bacterium]|nr:LysM peptidoglycan-binding domain-containing protein [Sulfuritalea sp.]MCF8175574.1 LysM peptidoglycan-binding domain-containing protein [Burkholderiaceae bacterium]MCF8184695.1 LysM peptidoglycan-binding domain-containing protein [Polynucleobacter sp.]
MRRIISALLISISSTLVLAQGVQPTDLADGAPDRHVVVRGDTLWGIAAKFLKDPYRWGELWKLNAEEIKNPQRIYPGQVIVLDRSGKEPRVKLETIVEQRHEYVEPLRKGIPSIRPQDIEPFLSEPRVLDKAGLEEAPRVVALQDDRVIAGAGDQIFTTEVKAGGPRLWQLFRQGKALLDPDTGETLGHEAVFLGTARLTKTGNPSSFLIVTSKQEIVRDDRLLVAPPQDVPSYIPRAPSKKIGARILSIYSGVNFGGPQSVITLNRGKADGLEPGHVFAVDLAGAEVTNRFEGEKSNYKLPDARNGLLFVFRVFDRVSYALVMNAVRPVVVGDTVRTP